MQDSYRRGMSPTLRPMARSKSTDPLRNVHMPPASSQSWLFNPHSKRSMALEAPMLQSSFMLG